MWCGYKKVIMDCSYLCIRFCQQKQYKIVSPCKLWLYIMLVWCDFPVWFKASTIWHTHLYGTLVFSKDYHCLGRSSREIQHTLFDFSGFLRHYLLNFLLFWLCSLWFIEKGRVSIVDILMIIDVPRYQTCVHHSFSHPLGLSWLQQPSHFRGIILVEDASAFLGIALVG